MIAEWAKHYIGIPFADRGRTRRGVDCWGLARLVLAEQFDKRLPLLSWAYDSAFDSEAVTQVVNTQKPLLTVECVERQRPGDLVLIRLRGIACHVGVYVGGGCMIHARRGTETCVESLRGPRWQNRVEGYYRV